MFKINFEKADTKEFSVKITENKKTYTDALHKLDEKRKSGQLGFMDLPSRTEAISKIKETAKWVQDNACNFIVLGIGGSSLGGKTILSSLVNPYAGSKTKVNIVDNVDPDYFSEIIDSLDLSKTVFNVISKSGSTAETMSQFLVVYRLLSDKLGKEEACSRIILTTDPKGGALRPLVSSMGFKSLEVPQNVGGRFSVLSDVGLLAAAVANVDIDSMLSGAADMVKTGFNEDIEQNHVLKYSVLKYLHAQAGRTISVLMPYSTKLFDLSAWYVQLWAESLGKKGLGQTPIPATGATDQHSQLQLFMEGPKDKFITFIGIDKPVNKVKIPEFDTKVEAFDYLSGHTMQELITSEMLSTEKALAENDCPSARINIESVNAYSIGQLFMFFELAVAITGELMNINAFDQPGVELSKKYTYQMMGRKGY